VGKESKKRGDNADKPCGRTIERKERKRGGKDKMVGRRRKKNPPLILIFFH
jgi:hypothetical protein